MAFPGMAFCNLFQFRDRNSVKRPQRPRPNSVRTPHAAAMPNAAMKATPIVRSNGALLLQPWSTATAQTKNSTIEMVPRIFSSMIRFSSGENDAGPNWETFCCKIPTRAVTPVTRGSRARGPRLTTRIPRIAARASADT